MSTAVKYFDSTMSGAPSLSNTAGALIGVLDACLVDGFGSVTVDGVDGLVVASDVATAKVSAGHQFAMIGNTGPVITISGATPSGLNGEWRVTVTSSTVFTFATSGIGDQTASGTITAKRSGAGFSRPFEDDVNYKAVYRSDDITGTRLFCRIDDAYTTYARIRGYEAMDDVDTVTDGYGVFPTEAQISGGGYVYKATSTNRPWTLFSDGQIVYFFCDAENDSFWKGGFVFGDIDSYASTDAFHCILSHSVASNGRLLLYIFASTSGTYIARSYTQLLSTGSVASSRYSHGKTTSLGSGGQAYPALADNSIHLWPVECWEGITIARGMYPGLWNPIHNGNVPHGTIISGITQLPGRELMVQNTWSKSNQCAIDLTGPWRAS